MTLIPRILIRHFNVTETNVDAARSEDASPVEKREKTEKRAPIPGTINDANFNIREGQVTKLNLSTTYEALFLDVKGIFFILVLINRFLF
jgi:sporulation protein YlmC with PRC-barrel domain